MLSLSIFYLDDIGHAAIVVILAGPALPDTVSGYLLAALHEQTPVLLAGWQDVSRWVGPLILRWKYLELWIAALAKDNKLRPF